MRPDLIISYRHCPLTATPSYVGIGMAEGVAMSMRQQLGLEDGRRLAVDLDMLTSITAVRVNDVAYQFQWHVGGPLTGDNGEPVLGVCEHDPDGDPDAALILINPDPVDGREELLLSTAAHESGHGIFEAPKWVLATQRARMPSLLPLTEPAAKRVHRTVTPDENHLAATPPRGSREFFEEVRANAFMGTFLAPSHRVYARLHHHCQTLGLSPADLRSLDSPVWSSRLDDLPVKPQSDRGNLSFLGLRLRMAINELLTRLARDFRVTKRFIEVRLRHYGFLARSKAVA